MSRDEGYAAQVTLGLPSDELIAVAITGLQQVAAAMSPGAMACSWCVS